MTNRERRCRRSIRLRDYDYSQAGTYFITICTQDNEFLFGDIVDGEMKLNGPGEIVRDAWIEIPNHFAGVDIDKFIVMPDHFHGILVITRRGEPCVRPGLGGVHPGFEGVRPGVGGICDDIDSEHISGEHPNAGEHKVRPYDICGTMQGSVGRVVQAFKSTTTVEYTRGGKHMNWRPFPGRLWQRNYYEHIIRTGKEIERIREYVINNPVNWNYDKGNPMNHERRGDEG